MKLHRFYIGDTRDKSGPLELEQSIWVHDKKLLNQWLKVLRYRAGDDLILFNEQTERLYKIIKVDSTTEVHLQLVTELERHIPNKHVYLLWALLKKDKNDWVLQKGTELGVSNFVPILADRSEKTGFDIERAQKIIIEAAEQCGRSDIPHVREPITTATALTEYANTPLFVCDQSGQTSNLSTADKVAILVGPEGGWSDDEKQLFTDNKINHIALGSFTLRAETAAIIAATKLFI